MKGIYFIVMFALFASLGFVLADSDDAMMGDNDNEQGLMGDNDPVAGSGNEEMAEAVQFGAKVSDGQHMGEDGNMFMVQTKAQNQYRIESNGVQAECDCEMTQEKVGNQTKLKVQLSNGVNAELKVMPDTASEKALEQIRIRTCNPENECSLELKEVGEGKKTQLAYELQTQRKAKFLGLFGSNMEVKAQISAENGEVLGVDKPWWAFLASEPAEE